MKQITTASLLSFTAGFVDTAGFIALFGLFTAHVTGNFALIGASFAEFSPGILAKLLALPVFVMAVAAARAYVLQRETRGADAAGGLLLAELLLLGLFLVAGIAAAPFQDADAPLTIVTGLVAVIAMAIQNAASRTVFAKLSPTTVMTGNVTQIVIDLVDLAGRPSARSETMVRLKKMTPPVLTFVLGATAGALGYVALGFWCMVMPMLSVAAVFLMRRHTVLA
jgi:uncharacterized membrane protein YoaK (UPF0700 family)